jgi:hypothetical protein
MLTRALRKLAATRVALLQGTTKSVGGVLAVERNA